MSKIFFRKKNLGKANLQLSERSEPRIPRVYRVPKAPSMRVYIQGARKVFGHLKT